MSRFVVSSGRTSKCSNPLVDTVAVLHCSRVHESRETAITSSSRRSTAGDHPLVGLPSVSQQVWADTHVARLGFVCVPRELLDLHGQFTIGRFTHRLQPGRAHRQCAGQHVSFTIEVAQSLDHSCLSWGVKRLRRDEGRGHPADPVEQGRSSSKVRTRIEELIIR